jgi:hypothetical protein
MAAENIIVGNLAIVIPRKFTVDIVCPAERDSGVEYGVKGRVYGLPRVYYTQRRIRLESVIREIRFVAREGTNYSIYYRRNVIGGGFAIVDYFDLGYLFSGGIEEIVPKSNVGPILLPHHLALIENRGSGQTGLIESDKGNRASCGNGDILGVEFPTEFVPPVWPIALSPVLFIFVWFLCISHRDDEKWH